MQNAKGRTPARYHAQFPKNNLKVHCTNIYIIKGLHDSGIHMVLSQKIITKPTQTEKLKIGK